MKIDFLSESLPDSLTNRIHDFLNYLFLINVSRNPSLYSDDINIKLSDKKVSINSTGIDKFGINNPLFISDKQHIFQRRWSFSFQKRNDFKNSLSKKLTKEVEDQLLSESKSIANFMEFIINKNSVFGQNSRSINHNKILDLENARNCGFNIPDTLITQNKPQLREFHNKYGKIICKPPSNWFNYYDNNIALTAQGVTLVKSTDIDDLSEQFNPM